MSRKLQVASEVSIMIAALATIPVVIFEGRGASYAWLPIADWLIWAVFAVVLFIGIWLAENRAQYLQRHPLDVAIVILSFPMMPSFLALTRLARLVRVMRVLRLATVVARAIPALKATIGRRELLYVFSVCALLVVAAAGMLFVLEPDAVDQSFLSALWWSTVTVTTVGYGDIAPTTLAGRIAAVVVMIAGLAVISTLSASIAAYFVAQGRQSDADRLEQRLERIESLLSRDSAERDPSAEG
jgi:voltage-gated potassium channel